MRLRLPWGETRTIEQDIEQFSLDVMDLVAEYYVDMPDPTLIVVRSTDFQVDDDTIVVKGCSVTFSTAFPITADDEEDFEQKWEDFMLVNRDDPDNPAHY